MADMEDKEDVEIGTVETSTEVPDHVQPAPPTVLEQARLGNLDLFRTELESGNHPLDFKAGRAVHFNRTPLHLAAMEGHEEIVKFILSRPEISREVVNAKDCFGYTPLHLAVRHSHESVVHILTTSSWVLPDRFLAATSEPDDLGSRFGGCTPLHLAGLNGYEIIARLLLRQPCQVEFAYDPVNLTAKNWNNSTPLDLAQRSKFWDLANILEASDSKWLQQEITRCATSANAILVGAALVVAATFGAWLQPPGGMPNSDSQAPSPASAPSQAPSSKLTGFSYFYLLITISFALSLISLVLGILGTFPYKSTSMKVNLPLLRRAVNLARLCLLGALACLAYAVLIASVLVFDKAESKNYIFRWSMNLFPSLTMVLIGWYILWA